MLNVAHFSVNFNRISKFALYDSVNLTKITLTAMQENSSLYIVGAHQNCVRPDALLGIN